MDAGKATISGVFNGSRLLEIPFYQRAYVWGEEQWERFLGDMAFVTASKRPYFLGSIILKQASSGTTWSEVSEVRTVIDGQQRLTTMVIFFIMDCGNIMNVGYEKMLLMQNSLNRSTTEIISTYVYAQGIAAGNPNYAYATAIGLFNSVINFLLIVIVNQICKKLGETSMW